MFMFSTRKCHSRRNYIVSQCNAGFAFESLSTIAAAQVVAKFMSSRNAYAALTPEFADFSFPPHSISGGPQFLSTAGISEDGQLKETQSRWCAALSAVRAAVNYNAGLLLVAASQAFFSLMNFSVKILNTIDPPVSALQVGFSYQYTIARLLMSFKLDHCCSNGNTP
jgi:hypothetical protein